jgi:hypothetical protein
MAKIWKRKIAYFYGLCSIGEWDDCECMGWVDRWEHVSLPIFQCITIEKSQLEEDPSIISPHYDHVSYLVQPSSVLMGNIILILIK